MPKQKLPEVNCLIDGYLANVNEIASGVYTIIANKNKEVKILVPEISKLGSDKKRVLFSDLSHFLISNFDDNNIPSTIILDSDRITADGEVLAKKRDGEWISNKSVIELIKQQCFYDFYTKNINNSNEGMNSNKTYGIRLSRYTDSLSKHGFGDVINRYINIDLSSYEGSCAEKQKVIQQHITIIKNAISNSYTRLEEMPAKIVIKNNPSDSTVPCIYCGSEDLYLSKKPGRSYVFEKIDFSAYEHSLSEEHQRLSAIKNPTAKIKKEIETVSELYKLLSEYNKSSIEFSTGKANGQQPISPINYLMQLSDNFSLWSGSNKVITDLLSDVERYKENILPMGSIDNDYFNHDTDTPHRELGVDRDAVLTDKLFEFERKLQIAESVIDQVRADKGQSEHLIRTYKDELAPFFSKNNGSIIKSLVLGAATDNVINKLFKEYVNTIKKDPALSQGKNWITDIHNSDKQFSDSLTTNIAEIYPKKNKPIARWSLLTEKVEINEYAKVTKSNYEFQIIFQLSHDKLVKNSAVKLAGKHHQGATSVIVQLDYHGSYRTFGVDAATGGFNLLEEHAFIDLLKQRVTNGKTKLRWQLVVHGEGVKNHESTTLSGQQPDQLANNLGQFYRKLQQHQVDIKPQQISLVGCKMTGSENVPQSFAYQFMKVMGDNGIKSTLSATTVDQEGHKPVVTAREGNSLVTNNAKVIFKWSEQGEIEHQFKAKSKIEDHENINKLNSLSDKNINQPIPESSPSINKTVVHEASATNMLAKIGPKVGRVMQGYDFISALRQVADYNRRVNSGELSPEQIAQMEQDLALTFSAIVSDFSIDGAQYGLNNKLGQGLLKHSKIAAGARVGMPVLSALSSCFDIYQAYSAFSKLAVESDSHSQRDLVVIGVFSTVNASIGIGMGIAMAIGGSLATYTGPVGMIAVVAMLAASQIYSAVTQIERIRDILPEMTIGERIENGLRLFFNMPVTEDIANKVNAKNAQKVRQYISEQQHHTYKELLKNSVDKDTLFYSRGDIRLHEIIHTRPSTSDTTIDYSPGLLGMGRPTVSRNNSSLIATEYKNYSLDEIQGVNDTIVADEYSDGTDNSVVRVGNIEYPVRPDKVLAQNKAALFSLGSGDDTARGYKNKSNVFMVEQGYKEFTGGNQSDTFIFNNPDIGGRVSQLDGGEGSDTIILAEPKSDDISNNVNLTSGVYTQLSTGKVQHIAKLSNIENIISHKSTNDTIIGNNQDNYLNGLGGKDTIFGYGGNDFIALQAGFAAGGDGIDTYHILQNSTEKTVEVIIAESSESLTSRTETSNILLDYSVEQITSLRRTGNGMLFELDNNNGSLTKLVLNDCYQSVEGKLLRVLDYNFITNDGFILTPQWPTELQKATEWFHPIMLAQYFPQSDRRYNGLLDKYHSQEITVRFELDGEKNGHSVTHLIKQPSGEELILAETVLPPVIRLSVYDMPILMGYLPNYELLGDDRRNVFLAKQNNGLLVGGGGSDDYIIQYNPANPMEIVIDNYDSEQAIDTLIFEGVEAYEFVATADEQDVILTHREKPAEYNHVRLVNYLQDEKYRHLALMDSSDPLMRKDNTLTGVRIHQIEVDTNGKPTVTPRFIPLATDDVNLNTHLVQLSELMASMPVTERIAVSDNYHQGLKNSGTHLTINTELSAA
ncbi:C80 family cysteine peptidase [Yersinia bercovieri]|uniref:C80 family cysteine peptidase n=1 Tax=Yersinia bercovieri TaxID=634 RepID=UPI001CFD5851|nr:C80 family cysteine peptidase [Yersinia bercovieri]MCB5301112.1 hypothetical protein [Yersinia bercovieri]